MATAVRPEVAPAAAGSPSPPRGHVRASRWWTLAAAAVVAVVLALPLAGAFRAPGAPMEEGKLLVGGELVLDGKVPHADFEHIYGPADVWLMAGSMAVLGHSVEAGRWLGLAYTVALIAGVFALGRRAGPVAAAGAAVVSGLFLAPFGVHAYSWTAGLALVLWGLVLALRCLPSRAGHRQHAGRARREGLGVVSGLLLGLALLFRPDLVLAVVAVLAATVFGMHPAVRKRLAIGLAVGLSPYLVHLALAGPRPVIEWMVITPLDRLRGGRSLPLPPPAGHLTAWFDLSAPVPAPSRVFPDTPLVTQFRLLFWLTVLAVVVCVGAAVVGWLRRDPVLVALGALAVAITPQMLQRADVTHVRFVACVVVALAPVALVAAVGLLDRRLPVALAGAEAVALLLVGLLIGAPQYLARLDAEQARRALGRVEVASVGNRGRSFPVRSPDVVPYTQAMIDRVDEVAPDGGRLFVGPRDLTLANYADTYLYFLFPQLTPASFYLESNTGVANRPGSGLAADIATADVLVLSTEFDNWDEPNDSTEPGPREPLDVVERDFCPAGTFAVYTVLTRCQ